MESTQELRDQIKECRICAADLPLGPRPVVQFSTSSQIVIVGQAPGTKVHASGIPWDDNSGDRLRDWLQLTPEQFYNDREVALMPMGFCYPGKAGGGDAPPRPECAPQWHARVLAQLPADPLLILAGQYAQHYYLGQERQRTLTETVRNYRQYLPRFLPIPHPSWRVVGWQKKNPWFADEVLQVLRAEVQRRLRPNR